MRYKVLITAPYFQPVVGEFAPMFARHEIEPVVPAVEERLSEEELLPLVADIDGAICGDDAYTETVLARAPRLRVISKWGTGIDAIDREACRRRGIVICNTPNAFSEPVADTTLGYMLAFVRELAVMTQEMRAGRWHKRRGRALGECTVGLIGVGNIGRAVARRLAPFGCRVLGADPVQPPAEVVSACRIEMVSLPILLAQSDIVSLHCDLNPTSFHILDAQTLALMQPTAVVINTARGRLIEEPALIQALHTGRLAGAALDVFEREPLPPESPLRAMDSVWLAPHNSNNSPRAWAHVHQQTVNNLVRHLAPTPAAVSDVAVA